MVRIAIALLLFVLLPSVAQAEKRIAFVVGIDKYDNLAPQQQLQRAVNDARSVSAALAPLGFEVVSAENVGRAAFNAQWQRFLDKIDPGDTVAVYFSGHGVEIEGLNFLLPRDVPSISFGRQEQLKRESLSVSELLLDLRKRKPQVTLLILDACRDNPLIPPEQRSLSLGRGLARMDAPNGTFIMQSAGAGETSLDRLPKDDPDKVNSIYTRRLLPLLKTPGLQLHEVARQLRREVHDLAGTVPHVQQPAYYDGLIGQFCLAGCNVSASAETSKPVPSARARCDGIEVTVGANDLRCVKPGSGKSTWFKDCPECPEMVVAPPGIFSMGSPKNEVDRVDWEGPQHDVTIAKPFAIARFAVTRGEFAAFVRETNREISDACRGSGIPASLDSGRSFRNPGFPQDDRHPAVCVSWDDAQAFAAGLAKKTNKPYRLLTEAEREYATRAGATTPFWWGSAISAAQANYGGYRRILEAIGEKGPIGEIRKGTVAVDSFRPNPWGLYNVHGNVWEWVEDCWHGNYEGAPSDGSAWTTECWGVEIPSFSGGPSRSVLVDLRVLRGGSWSDGNLNDGTGWPLRSASRNNSRGQIFTVGFRLGRTLNP
jgi:formylglycine-generating enzyme required for sulfatase activity